MKPKRVEQTIRYRFNKRMWRWRKKVKNVKNVVSSWWVAVVSWLSLFTTKGAMLLLQSKEKKMTTEATETVEAQPTLTKEQVTKLHGELNMMFQSFQQNAVEAGMDLLGRVVKDPIELEKAQKLLVAELDERRLRYISHTRSLLDRLR